MKFQLKTTFFVAVFAMISAVGKAQFASNFFTPKPKGIFLPRENSYQRWGFGLNYGLHPMSVTAATVKLKYTDESPAPDILQQNISLTNSNGAMIVGGGIEWQSKRNLMHRMYFAGGRNGKSNTRAGYFSFGMGYAMGTNRFQFYPMIDLVASNAKIEFGDMENSTGYVEINGTKFENDKIQTSMKLSFAGFRPSMGFHFAITKRLGIQASIGYINGNANNDASLDFSATNPNSTSDNDTSVSASEKLSEPNLEFYVNNKRVTTRPDVFGLKGMSYNIGITFGRNKLLNR